MNSWAELAIPPFDARYIFPSLQLKSTATDELVSLPQNRDIRMYVCGITPYDATHLGHAATYIAFDLVNRYIRSAGQIMHFIENVTDIDDPLLERARRDNVSWESLATSQIELFRSDMTDLHVIPPEHLVGAVESIPLVIDAIGELQKNGATYSVSEDIYFRVRIDPGFGTRAHLSDEEMVRISKERGGDPDRPGKEDPLDAMLWMQKRENEPGWPSPLGIGRPGWHIECCAIALNYIHSSMTDDYSIDIQGGGSDLQFPHHEIGASQARALNGKDFARVYMHAGMIGYDGEKMSKSKGNLVLVSTLVA
ncbi:MAG: cysteine--1-D-myo-inosityl 2-amino-2-deoxy-alpha-D-glucopyranoside ligase, partial [Actinobacteria bacterium]|nr:cysteine--1-D-myo-inosityl 2-amino-2-deoxy-alpha-D-glucopyranoside ligase [Actinomycetota bacterium]